MKFSLFTISIVAVLLALVGCADQETPKVIDSNEPVTVVPGTNSTYGIRKVCIDGVSYLLHSHTIIPQVKPSGNLMVCEVKRV